MKHILKVYSTERRSQNIVFLFGNFHKNQVPGRERVVTNFFLKKIYMWSVVRVLCFSHLTMKRDLTTGLENLPSHVFFFWRRQLLSNWSCYDSAWSFLFFLYTTFYCTNVNNWVNTFKLIFNYFLSYLLKVLKNI